VIPGYGKKRYGISERSKPRREEQDLQENNLFHHRPFQIKTDSTPSRFAAE
jgi:hypothetical protein